MRHLVPVRLRVLGSLAVTTALLLTGCSSGSDDEEVDDAPAAAGGEAATDPDAAAAADATAAADAADAALAGDFARLEETYAARLGVYAVDTGTGATVEHRADERFASASTHKVLSAAAVLLQTDAAGLEEVLRYEQADIVVNSPVAEDELDSGLTLFEAIRAAITVSDNTAGNLLLERVGGPEGLQSVVREWGDETTSVDRWEPELNDWDPDETRDTTTPRAMARNLEALVLGDALPDANDRDLLLTAMRYATTGDDLIRAGVPEGWLVADKTGTAAHGTRNDIAVIHPPEGDPIVLAIYSNRLDPDAEPDPALLAEATRLVIAHLTG
ncbi:MAG TPA: class A beta-lactamase [Acidimicrobiales bacterium]